MTCDGPLRICSSGPDGPHPDPRPARQDRRRRRHAPVRAAAGRLGCARQGRAQHHDVRAGREGLGEVAAPLHAAVRDHRHVPSGLRVVRVPRRRDVRDRGDLRDADAQDLARRAGGARPDADEDRRRALLHEQERGLGVGRVADRDRDRHEAGEVLERERARSRWPGGGRDETCDWTRNRSAPCSAQNGPNLRATPGVAETAAFEPAAWSSSIRRAIRSSRIGAAYASARTSWTAVVRRGDDAVEDLGRVVVAGLDALEVEDRQAAESRQLAREAHVRDGVHGRGEDRDVEVGCRRSPGPGPRRPDRPCRYRGRARRPRTRRSGGSSPPSSGRPGGSPASRSSPRPLAQSQALRRFGTVYPARGRSHTGAHPATRSGYPAVR